MIIINGILNTGSGYMDRRVSKGHGEIKFKLADRMKERGLSKNKLCMKLASALKPFRDII